MMVCCLWEFQIPKTPIFLSLPSTLESGAYYFFNPSSFCRTQPLLKAYQSSLQWTECLRNCLRKRHKK
ncbi:hypothetical protein O6P43_001742 [Quillaja saponaria]|uniref:Uncharacterized protein n=1 Tax=Quillaja saponaria TaxID=32244 RepID=A0AAD7VPI6_QUISA|nr:hypothetical protein O6P43_001742 [Quillaja saponaria]